MLPWVVLADFPFCQEDPGSPDEFKREFSKRTILDGRCLFSEQLLRARCLWAVTNLH